MCTPSLPGRAAVEGRPDGRALLTILWFAGSCLHRVACVSSLCRVIQGAPRRTRPQHALLCSHSKGNKAEGALLEASAGYSGPNNVRVEGALELLGLTRQGAGRLLSTGPGKAGSSSSRPCAPSTMTAVPSPPCFLSCEMGTLHSAEQEVSADAPALGICFREFVPVAVALVAQLLSPFSIAPRSEERRECLLPVTRPRIGIGPAVTGRGGDQVAGALTKP